MSVKAFAFTTMAVMFFLAMMLNELFVEDETLTIAIAENRERNRESLPAASDSFGGTSPYEAPRSRRDRRRDGLVIKADRAGHYVTDVELNNRDITMLVDTGATFVALRASDAQAAGIRVKPGDYTIPVRTANGEAMAARVNLKKLTLAGLKVTNHQVHVLPDESLDISLLGMTVLSRFSTMQFENGELVLVK